MFRDDVRAPITLSFPDDTLGTFTNVCLFLHVAVAYCINSSVLTKSICQAVWPSVFLAPHRQKEKVVRWGLVSTGILCGAIFIAILVPFFSDLMNIYSSIGIFSLSFAVPSLLWIFGRKYTSQLSLAWNVLIIVLATVGAGMGCWAAVKDISHNWATCHYKIHF